MPLLTKNPYLEGNYAPVRDERHDTNLVVEGTIPSELNGTLLRNGPNPTLDLDVGWVLCVVNDEASRSSAADILDATRFAAAPIVTIHLPRRNPYGFPGAWILGTDADALDSLKEKT